MTEERYKQKVGPALLRINVDKDIIDDSQQRNSSHCMVAEAVKRACWIKGIRPHAVAVDIQTIRFSDPNKGARYVYLTPRIAQQAIINFDQGDPTEPFKFTLSKGQVTKIRHNSPNQKKRIREWHEQKRATTVIAAKDSTNRPNIDGGKPPPVGSLARRRSYGLHALRA